LLTCIPRFCSLNITCIPRFCSLNITCILDADFIMCAHCTCVGSRLVVES
jgi:hypothetical protein